MSESTRLLHPAFLQCARALIAILCCLAIAPGELSWAAFPQQADASQEQADKLPPDQLDSLVAPIALYPDSMLSQVLVASTYPLEIIQLQQWLAQNKNLKDKALSDAAMKQPWDPSVQAMAALPDVVKQLAENIKWTTDLGNAFLAQQSDVMDAVQRMRTKAKDKGNLKTSEQQKVETKVIENKQVIIIEPSSPEVVYVPSYNPTVVYGPPAYAYPPIAYPPPGAYLAGAAISFGVGMAIGAAWGGGGWGWGCGWGSHNDITINNNNNFNRNTNIQGGNRVNAQGGNRVNAGGNTWQHNPQHRGGAPYSDRATANKFGGSARGDSLQQRQDSARRQQGNRGGASADRASNRGGARGGPSAGTMDRGGNRGADRASAGSMDRGGNRGSSGGGGDRVGNRSVSSGASSRGGGAFGGGGGSSGSSARASSSRGASSFGGGGSRGGARSGGGGGRRR